MSETSGSETIEAVSAPELLSWYSKINAKYLDLVGDYAGKERFFVEADSLLLECFSNPELDFDPGFQVLHAVYLVEQFLHNLLKRGCVFDVVFFHQHERNCLPKTMSNSSRYLLTREVIIKHLQANTVDINIFRFDSLEDKSFQAYLENSAVYFALCSDGARYAPKDPSSLKLQAYTNGSTKETVDESSRIRLRSMIYRLEQFELDVALINGLSWRDSKVFAFVLEGSCRYARHPDIIDEEISSAADELLSHKQWTTDLTEESRVIPDAQMTLSKGGFQKPSSRLLITIVALRILAAEGGVIRQMVLPCLIHTLLIELTPLADRAVSTIEFGEAAEDLYNKFTNSFAQACLQVQASLPSLPADPSLADIFDGRVFRAVLGDYSSNVSSLPKSCQQNLHPRLTQIIVGKTPIGAGVPEEFKTSTNTPKPISGIKASDMSSILPFSHPAFDKHLSQIKVQAKAAPGARKSGRDKDMMKWSNKKRYQSAPTANQPVDVRTKKRIMRKHYRFMADMQLYAASLTNANGKALSPELIIVGEPQVKQSAKPLPLRPSNGDTKSGPNSRSGGGKKKNPQSSMRDKIAAETAQLTKKREDTTFVAWTRAREERDQEVNLFKKYNMILAYSRDISNRKDLHTISDEIELYQVSVLVHIWAEYCRKGRRENGQHIAALIYDGLLRLASSPYLTKTTFKAANDIAQLCGMSIPRKQCPDGRPLSFKTPVITDVSLNIGRNPLEFKLLEMGPYLERAMDQKDDPRVTFKPDGWQRKVLDELDASNSVLVVAPTSSGKTFISFYAMEKVLRESNEGVIVYIAPTKALVNQIAAEIQARFTKNYEFAGTSIYAISTRDQKLNNPKQCQVLVTVPYILQIMLMSPNNKAWVPRVKTIILDEVHSIGQAEDGLIWEQLLLMAPCQIVALSATVGNSEAFASWLSSAQSALGRKFDMIKHEHRFSDLRKYVFETPEKFEFTGLPDKPLLAPLGLEDLDGVNYLHPVCCLSHPQRGIPDDLSLESRDCFLLWQAMMKFGTNQYPMIESLSPIIFFGNVEVIKADVIRWGTELKELLSQWMKDPESPFQKVVTELGKGLPMPKASVKQREGAVDVEDLMQPEAKELFDGTLPLLCTLQSGNALPAILFNFDRTACEDIVRHLDGQLSDAEARFKETDSAWKVKLEKFAVWKKATAAQKAASKKDAAKKSKKASGEERDDARNSALGEGEDALDLDSGRFESFDPDMPLPKYSFADPKKADAVELAKLLSTFRWVEIDEKIIDAFQRGVAVHHAGMNRRYRQAVEIWFRRGFLTVIVATGTLSLGINMPCKTVVFSGDSVYLTALNFRQSAGRSGRRGFDLLGNVVFQSISTQKACRLLSSRLPDLNGHFPLTTNFVLRLLALLHGTDNVPYAMQMVNSLLSQPRIYLGGKSFSHQVLHHVRFSIEYLRSQGLIDVKGAPINFARSVCHLSTEENSAFAMHALLKDGYFHGLAEDLAANEEKTLRTLMLVMANLFGRQPMRMVHAETKLTNLKASSSVVFLPPMPEEAIKILSDHDQMALATYVTYVKTFVEQHCKEPDTRLPMTGVQICPTELKVGEAVATPTAFTTKLRSPFVALSGHADSFSSISDLCSSVRDGVFLEQAVIPHLDVGDQLQVPLNAYLYDYYQHGNVDELIKANRIQRGDVWYLLNDFSIVLATIVASLENLLKNDDTGDLDMANVGGLGDEIENELDAKGDVADDDDETVVSELSGTTLASKTNFQAVIAQQKAAEKPRKKKKVVADSWDDEASDDDDGSGSDSEGEGSGLTVEEEAKAAEQAEKRLKMVYLMFKRLKVDFDTKFRKMWA